MRYLIYASCDPSSEFWPQYIQEQLRLLAPIFPELIVVAPSAIPAELTDQLSRECKASSIVSDTSDYWEAWQAGLAVVEPKNLGAGDSVTLLRSGTFGPTTELRNVLARMDKSTCDYWTMCEVVGTPAEGTVPADPYFLNFSASIIKADKFQHLFQNLAPKAMGQTSYSDLLRALEGVPKGAAFEFAAEDFIPNQMSAIRGFDATKRPDLWAEAQVPFLPVNDIASRQDFAPYALAYLENGGFSATIAAAHLSQVDQPDTTAYLAPKQRNYQSSNVSTSLGTLTAAIHIHAHYPELLPELLNLINGYNFPFEVFVTTTANKTKEVTKHLQAFKFPWHVEVGPNKGRDVLPLIHLHPKLQKFDLIAHFHTKMTKHDRAFVGETWRRELLQMLVQPGNAIVSDFSTHPELGIVIADIPSFFRYNRSVIPESEARLVPMMQHLWEKMNLGRKIDFAARHHFIMSYGTFFWARRTALQPLLDLDIAAEIPPEPLPENNTILHAIERILVYVAWARGYDFSIGENHYLTAFADEPAPVATFTPLSQVVKQKISERIPTKARDALRPLLRRNASNSV
jgi:rhamnosyltransferase